MRLLGFVIASTLLLPGWAKGAEMVAVRLTQSRFSADISVYLTHSREASTVHIGECRGRVPSGARINVRISESRYDDDVQEIRIVGDENRADYIFCLN